MAESSTVAALQDILAAQYNNLRKDVLDTTLGHLHDGTNARTHATVPFTTTVISTTALATPSALSATQATLFASTVSGAAIMGFGTAGDVTLKNRAGTDVLTVGPNSTAVTLAGALTVSTGGGMFGTVSSTSSRVTTQIANSAGNNAGFDVSLAGSLIAQFGTRNVTGSNWTYVFVGPNGLRFCDTADSDTTVVASISTTGLGTFAGLALGATNLTMTGTISATGARVTQSYHTNITSTNAVTVDSSLLSKVPESIHDYTGDALAILRRVRVVGYRHLDCLDPSNRQKLGVIAETVDEPLALQEIENPSGDGTTYPGVNLMALIALQTRAIQQLEARLAKAGVN